VAVTSDSEHPIRDEGPVTDGLPLRTFVRPQTAPSAQSPLLLIEVLSRLETALNTISSTWSDTLLLAIKLVSRIRSVFDVIFRRRHYSRVPRFGRLVKVGSEAAGIARGAVHSD